MPFSKCIKFCCIKVFRSPQDFHQYEVIWCKNKGTKIELVSTSATGIMVLQRDLTRQGWYSGTVKLAGFGHRELSFQVCFELVVWLKRTSMWTERVRTLQSAIKKKKKKLKKRLRKKMMVRKSLKKSDGGIMGSEND